MQRSLRRKLPAIAVGGSLVSTFTGAPLPAAAVSYPQLPNKYPGASCPQPFDSLNLDEDKGTIYYDFVPSGDPWTESERGYAEQAMRAWEATYATAAGYETADGSRKAVRFAPSTGVGHEYNNLFHFYKIDDLNEPGDPGPSDGDPWGKAQCIPQGAGTPDNADIFVSERVLDNPDDLNPAVKPVAVFMHEIGHALGFHHAGKRDANKFGTPPGNIPSVIPIMATCISIDEQNDQGITSDDLGQLNLRWAGRVADFLAPGTPGFDGTTEWLSGNAGFEVKPPETVAVYGWKASPGALLTTGQDYSKSMHGRGYGLFDPQGAVRSMKYDLIANKVPADRAIQPTFSVRRPSNAAASLYYVTAYARQVIYPDLGAIPPPGEDDQGCAETLEGSGPDSYTRFPTGKRQNDEWRYSDVDWTMDQSGIQITGDQYETTDLGAQFDPAWDGTYVSIYVTANGPLWVDQTGVRATPNVSS